MDGQLSRDIVSKALDQKGKRRMSFVVDVCSVSGCSNRVFARNTCRKHYEEMRKSGEIKRTKYDKNEIEIQEGHAVVSLYDKFGAKVAEAKISIEDIDEVSCIKWSRTGAGYVHGTIEKKKTLLHRFLFRTNDEVDHINGDRLDNRRSNLRASSSSQNKMNKGRQCNNSSGYKGITRTGSGYCASISVGKERIYLGHYKCKEDAAAAYDSAAKVHFGEFARLNFG